LEAVPDGTPKQTISSSERRILKQEKGRGGVDRFMDIAAQNRVNTDAWRQCQIEHPIRPSQLIAKNTRARERKGRGGQVSGQMSRRRGERG
jgi:hypothetical protein